MTRRKFVVRQAMYTAAWGVLFGLIFHNPNWLWNIPLGLLLGAVVGWLTWPVFRRVEAWLDRKADPR